jgi:hypothetical protein
VSGDSYALGVGNAKSHRLIDSGLGIGDELFQIRVVGFLRISASENKGMDSETAAPFSRVCGSWPFTGLDPSGCFGRIP